MRSALSTRSQPTVDGSDVPRLDTASCVVSKQQVFTDSQVSCCYELLPVFAPERMAGGCADEFVGTFNPQVQNLGVLVDELCRDEESFTGIR